MTLAAPRPLRLPRLAGAGRAVRSSSVTAEVSAEPVALSEPQRRLAVGVFGGALVGAAFSLPALAAAVFFSSAICAA